MTYQDAKALFEKIKIELSENEYEKFSMYENTLLDWNEKINLTAITDDYDVWLKHFVDSCTLKEYISQNVNMIDVGTGAGFPSIPIKIINEDMKLTLLDSLNKRIDFLKEICEKLSLGNVEFVHGRAEDIAHDNNHREKYDIAVARAVANLATLAEYCLPFVKKDGIFLCMKAGNCEDEIESGKNSIKELGGIIEKVDKFTLPDGKNERTIIVIRKINNTKKIYPRKAGIPSKKPIE
jgi:16S rRNA (guanine527-N7)-methyltransferase